MVALLALSAAACGSDDDEAAPETTAVAETTVAETTSPESTTPATTPPTGSELEAASVTGITVDGDAADWETVSALEVTLEPLEDPEGESPEPKDSSVKVAYDSENVYVLVQVEDDYNWDPADAHLSASGGVMWAIDSSAGEGMGATEDDQETSLGAVDIWHWELECAAGTVSGGSTSEAGVDEETGEANDLGNDAACNFDDEWSTDPETREDDNGEGAENSLAGAWSHSAPTADAPGTWTLEMSRPLDTGDSTDAAFAAGGTAQLGIAYWDPDTTDKGWEDDGHVTSAKDGWITVTFAE